MDTKFVVKTKMVTQLLYIYSTAERKEKQTQKVFLPVLSQVAFIKSKSKALNTICSKSKHKILELGKKSFNFLKISKLALQITEKKSFFLTTISSVSWIETWKRKNHATVTYQKWPTCNRNNQKISKRVHRKKHTHESPILF